jgi:uncharacterized protein YcbK (DUF882 family)
MDWSIERKMNRRAFLRVGALALAGISLPTSAIAAMRVRRERSLSFYNLHTGESLKTVYYADGRYLPEGLNAINYLMRDFRLNLVKPIDPRLLDLLHSLNFVMDTSAPFNLISGYRSPQTNAMLHAHSEGVAVHSLHIDGRAADIRVPGRSLGYLRRAAIALRGGGVGYYPASDFVHVDTGRVRYW